MKPDHPVRKKRRLSAQIRHTAAKAITRKQKDAQMIRNQRGRA